MTRRLTVSREGIKFSAPKSQGDSQDLGVFYRSASSDANRIDASLRRSTRGLERSQLFGVNLRPGEPGSPPAGPPRRQPLDLHARVCRG